MSEKTPKQQFDALVAEIRALTSNCAFIPHVHEDLSDNRPLSGNGRICGCCGVAPIGETTYRAAYERNKYPDEVGSFTSPNLIGVGFVGKEELPELYKGRNFLRLPSEIKDFLMTWDDL